MVPVSFTEEEFISSLKEQGFIVERVEEPQMSEAEIAVMKEKGIADKNVTGRSTFKISKPMRTPAALAGSGYVPANNTVFATYTVVQGFNYFVSLDPYGIEMVGSSKYSYVEKSKSATIISGGLGAQWYVTGQFYYSESYSISLSAGWSIFGGSIGGSVGGSSNYNYWYPAFQQTDTYYFPDAV